MQWAVYVCSENWPVFDKITKENNSIVVPVPGLELQNVEFLRETQSKFPLKKDLLSVFIAHWPCIFYDKPSDFKKKVKIFAQKTSGVAIFVTDEGDFVEFESFRPGLRYDLNILMSIIDSMSSTKPKSDYDLDIDLISISNYFYGRSANKELRIAEPFVNKDTVSCLRSLSKHSSVKLSFYDDVPLSRQEEIKRLWAS